MEKNEKQVLAAKKMVAKAQKAYESGNAMYYFVILNGVGWKAFPLMNVDGYNYKLIIDEIHNYQAEHPEKNIKEGYNMAISSTIKVLKNTYILQLILNYLNYEVEKEKNGTSSFKLDYKELLTQLRAAISAKADLLVGKNPDFDIYVNQQIINLEEKSSQRK